VCYNAHNVRRKLILLLIPVVLGLTAGILAACFLLSLGRAGTATLFAETGEVTVLRGSTTLTSQATGMLEVRSGDRIRTSSDSGAMLVWSPTDSAFLGSGCEVVLGPLPTGGAESLAWRLEVQQGDTSFQALASSNGESWHEIRTPAAQVVLALGRCRVAVSDGGETVVEVSEGVAKVLARDTTVEVRPGEYTSVIPGRAPAVPRPLVARFVFVSERTGNPEIWLLDEQGRETQLTFDPAPDLAPAWSPDGVRIAFETARDGNSEIYVMDADGSNPVNLTSNPADDHAPVWSQDGAHIAFQSERDGTSEIYLMNADGTEQVRETFGPGLSLAPQWEPDGSGIVFYRTDGDTSGDGLADARDMTGILVLPLDGGSPGYLWGAGEVFDQMIFPWSRRAVG
jgi:WD40 repeat protein